MKTSEPSPIKSQTIDPLSACQKNPNHPFEMLLKHWLFDPWLNSSTTAGHQIYWKLPAQFSQRCTIAAITERVRAAVVASGMHEAIYPCKLGFGILRRLATYIQETARCNKNVGLILPATI